MSLSFLSSFSLLHVFFLYVSSLLIYSLHSCSIFLPFFPLLFSFLSSISLLLFTFLLSSSSVLFFFLCSPLFLSLLAYSSLSSHPPLLLPPEGISQFNIPLTLSNPIITPEKCPTADTLGTKT